MARHVTIITPENIPLTMEPAGIGTRFGALLLDILILFGILIGVSIIGGILAAVFSWSGLGSLGGALLLIAIFLIFFGYFLLLECLWNGQTPGKRAFGLRVVRDGGYPIDFYSAAIRNLVRIADFLPIAYAAGAICIFFQADYKRLGDLVAGTIVVKERPTDPLAAFRSGPKDKSTAGLPPTVRNPYETLSGAELSLLRRFVMRRFEMTPDDAERLAYRLIVPMIERLNITFVANVPPRYADLAAVLVRVADQREEEFYAQGVAR